MIASEFEADERIRDAAHDMLKLVKDIANLDHYCLAHGNKTLINDLREWKMEARAAIAKAERADHDRPKKEPEYEQL